MRSSRDTSMFGRTLPLVVGTVDVWFGALAARGGETDLFRFLGCLTVLVGGYVLANFFRETVR